MLLCTFLFIIFLSRSKNFYCCFFFLHCGLTKKKKPTSFPKEAWRLEFRLRKTLICKPNSTWLCRTFSFLLLEGLVTSNDASLTWRVTRRRGGLKEEEGGEPRWRHRAWLSLLPHPLLKNEDTQKLWELPFQTDQCTKFVFAFYVFVSFYLIQDSSLQCLLRGVGGGLPLLIPPVVHSRLVADISLKTLSSLTRPRRFARHNSGLLFLLPCFTADRIQRASAYETF